MQSEYLDRLEAQVRRDWGHLGEQVTPSGTRCIGHVSHVGPHAWLHRFYAGCPGEQLDAVEWRMSRRIPLSWRSILSRRNGVKLFVDKVSLCGVLVEGLRHRSITDSPPLSLEDLNGLQRPAGRAVAADDFVLGGTTLGPVSLYLLRRDDSVAKVSLDGSQILSSWHSAEEMIAGEYAVARALCDREGRFLES